VKGFIAARNVTCNVNDVIKIAEEKSSSVSKEEWTARCMYMKQIEEEYLKLEPATDEMSEQSTVNIGKL
jgi:hypothetical protein